MPAKRTAKKRAAAKAKPAEAASPNTKHAVTETRGPGGDVYFFDERTRRRLEAK